MSIWELREDLRNNFDLKELKLVKFASSEKDPFAMVADLQVKFTANLAQAMACYRFNEAKKFNEDLKVGLENRKAEAELVKETKKHEQEFAKRNLGKPFVGQVLDSIWGYDATIIDYFQVVRVSKYYVWIKDYNGGNVLNGKTVRRRIHWNERDPNDYSISVDKVRCASPWDGVERQEDLYD